jgi:tape measure domain-containing protein
VAGGEALRRLYAEVGWKIDDAPLRKLDKILDDLKKSMLGGSVERFEEELAEAGEEAKDLGKELKKTGNIASTAMDDAAGGARRLKRETRDAGDEADRSRKKFQRFGDALERISRSMTSGIWRMGSSLLRAPFSLPGMLLGGAATYGAVRYGFMNPLRMASEFEQAEIAFTTMLGSAEKAREFIEEMNRFAVETPFDVAGVQDAAKRMLAFGFRQDQIIPYLTAIGNAAAGLGGGTDLIDRISLAIGQMQAKAKVSAEEMLQLTEAGIPAWEILSKKMGKSTQEVMKLSEKGLIPASEAIEMLIEGMNERFPDMLKKQANSLDGLKNQIVETFNLTAVKRWGDGLARALKPRLDSINRWIENNEDKIQRWGEALERAAFEGFDYLLQQGERVFNYIRLNYLENEEFQSLPFNKKIEYVFSDIEKKITEWYNSGGKEKIEEAAQNFVNFTAGVLEASVPQMTEIGLKLGKSIGSGLISGLREVMKDHPILSGLATAAITPGPLPVKAAAGVAVTAQGYTEQIKDSKFANDVQTFNKNLLEKLPTDKVHDFVETIATFGMNKIIDGSNQDGLPYVPKDDYIARLHEGERVLTKQENREYTKGRAAQSVTPAISATINVNVSGTAAAGGSAAVKAAAKQGAREGLEEFWRSLRRNNPAILEV